MVSGASETKCMEKLWTSNVSIGKCCTEEFCLQIYGKNGFRIGQFVLVLPLLMQTLEYKVSPYIIFLSIWTTFWQSLNKIVWSEHYKSLSLVYQFWQRIDAILNDTFVTENIFDAKEFIQKLSSFNVLKFNVIRHV